MNKIFKVIWSKSKQCYVVVSEMAKNTTGKKKIIVASILAGLATQSCSVMAAGAPSSSNNVWGATTPGGVAIGQNSVASGATAVDPATGTVRVAPSIAIGLASSSAGLDTITIGIGAGNTKSYGISMGKQTNVGGDYGIAIGYQTSAMSDHAVAIGEQTRAPKMGATVMGVSARGYGQGSVSLGWQALAGADVYGSGINIGTNPYNDTAATINSYQKWGDTAIGLRAVATGGNATALGRSARAAAENSIAIGGGNGDNFNNNTEKTEASAAKATAIGYNAKATAGDTLALGTSSKASGSDALAVGVNANASNSDSIAIGQDTVSNNINSVAFGRSSQATGSSATALGAHTKATDTGAVAIGLKAEATKEGSISIGQQSAASGLKAITTGYLSAASGENAAAYGNTAKAVGKNSLALGANTQATVEGGVALGAGSIANTVAGAGYNPNTGRTNTFTGLSGNALTSTWAAVSIGDGTNTRQLTGLAAGTNNTDAVNVAQLKSMNLAFTADGSTKGDVNLTNSALNVVGDSTYITTKGNNQTLTISGKKQNITVTNGTASASAGMADANNVAQAINQANADQTISYKANNGTANTVKVSDGLNFTNGTSTVATVGANGQVTYDLNSTTKQSITDSSTAVNRTIALGSDSGSTTAKKLSTSAIAFNIKGDTGANALITTTATGDNVSITPTAKLTAAVAAAENAANKNLSNISSSGETVIKNLAKGAAQDAVKVAGTGLATVSDNTVGGVKTYTVDVNTGNLVVAANGQVGAAGTTGASGATGSNGVATTQNVATAINDAVTKAKASTTQALADAEHKFAGDTGATSVRKHGEVLSIKGGVTTSADLTTGNIGVVSDGAGTLNIRLAKVLSGLTSATFTTAGGNTTAINGDGVTITPSGAGASAISMTTAGINAGNKEIKGIATGTTADAAVNKAQMDAAITAAAGGSLSTEKVVAKTLSGDTNLATVTGQTGTAKGETYEVAVSENAVKNVAKAAAQDAVTVTGTGLATVSDNTTGGVKTYTVDVNTGNLVVDANGQVGANGTTSASGAAGSNGVATTQNVATAINDAITKSNANTAQALADAKHNFAGDDATVISRKHGEQLNIKGGASTTATDLTSGNIAVVGDTTSGTLNIKMAKALTGLTSATFTDGSGNTQTVTGGSSTITDGAGNTTTITKGGITTTDAAGNTTTTAPTGVTVTPAGAGATPISVTTSGISAGNKEIKNVANGTTDDAAVNKKQVDDALKGATDNTVSLGSESGTTTAKKLSTTGGIKFNIKGETGANALITTSATGDDVTIAPTAKLSAAVTAAEKSADKDLSNLSAAGDTYIKNLAKTAASWNVETNGAGTTAVSGGESVNFINGDNIAITNAGRAITIGTAKNVSFDKVTVGGIVLDKTDGINAGGKEVKGIADGTAADSAVSKGQMETAIANAQTAATSTEKVIAKTLTGDTNLATVTGQTGTAKGETYEVAVSENAVKNVAKAAAQDAVTVTGTGLATVSDNTTGGVKTYTVNVDEGKLVLDDTTGQIGANGSTQGTTAGKNGVATTQNVATAINDAVTKANANNAQALADAKHNFAGDDATVISRKHGEQLNIKGGASTTATDLTSGNIAVVGDTTTGTLNIKMAKALTGLTSATYTDGSGNTQTVTGTSSTITDGAGNTTAMTKGGLSTTDGTNTTTVAPAGVTATDGTHTVKLNGSGIDAGNAQIKNVGKATTDDAAVNKKQMDDAVKAATDATTALGNNTIALGSDAGSTTAKKLSTNAIMFNIKGDTGANALITTSATGDDVTIAPTAKLTAAVTAAEKSADKDLSNLSAAGDTYIKNLAKTAASWNVETNGAGTTAVAGGESVNFINGDNIAITNAGRAITIGTAKNVSFDKVTVGGIVLDKTDGINAGGKEVKGIADGTAADSAVSKGQMETAIANAQTAATSTEKVIAKALTGDTNLATVTGQTGIAKGETYEVAVSENAVKNVAKEAAQDAVTVTGTGLATVSDNTTGGVKTYTVNVDEGKLVLDDTTGKIGANGSTQGSTAGKNGVATTQNVATAINDAVTKANANNAQALADAKHNFAGDDATVISRKHGEQLNIKGGASTTATDLTSGNIAVVGDTASGTLNIKMAKALTGLTSATFTDGSGNTQTVTGGSSTITDGAGHTTAMTKGGLSTTDGTNTTTVAPAGVTATDGTNTVKLNGSGIDAGNTQIKNVGKATTDDAAVNKKQMDDAVKSATDATTALGNNTIALGSDAGSTTAKKLSTNAITFNIKGDTGANALITTSATGDNVTIAPTAKLTAAVTAAEKSADKDLSNISSAGKTVIKDLAVTSAQDAVNVTGTGLATVSDNTTGGVKTYTVNVDEGKLVLDDTTGKIGANGSTQGTTAGKNGVATTQNVATAINDAITKSNANTAQALADAEHKFDGDTGTTSVRKHGEVLSIKGGVTTPADLTTGNIGVVSDGAGTLNIRLAKVLSGLTSATFKDASGNTTMVTGGSTTIADTAGNTQTLAPTKSEIKDTNGVSTVTTKDGVTAKDASGQTTSLTKGGVDATDGNGNTTSLTNTGVSATDGNGHTTGLTNGGLSTTDGTNITTVAPTGITATDGTNTVKLNGSGIDAGNTEIKNVGKATTDDAAVNKKQMDDAITKATADATHEFGGDDATVVSRKHGEKLTIKGGASTNAADFTSGNIAVIGDATNGALNIKLAKALTGLTSATFTDTAGNTTTVTGGSTTIADTSGNTQTLAPTKSEIKDNNGVSTVTTKDGVTAKDASGQTTSLTKGGVNATDGNGNTTSLTNTGVSATDGNGHTTGLTNGGLSTTDGTNTTTVAPTGMTATDGTHTVKVEGSGIDAGGTQIKNVGKATTDDAAVNKKQMDDAITKATADATHEFAGDTGSNSVRKHGEVLSIKGGVANAADLTTGNIGVVSDGAGTLNIRLAKALTGLTSATFTDTAGNTTTVTGGSTTIADTSGNIQTLAPTKSEIKDNNGVSTVTTKDGVTAKDASGQMTSLTKGGVDATDGHGHTTGLTNGGLSTTDGTNTTTVAPTGMTATDGSHTVKVDGSGIDAGNTEIKHIAAGTSADSAVNKGQMDDAITKATADATHEFAGDTGSNSVRKHGEVLSIKGGVTDTNKLSDNNIGVISDGAGTLNVKLSKNLTGLTSSTFTDGSGNTQTITGASSTITDGTGNTTAMTKGGLSTTDGTNTTTVAPTGVTATDGTNIVKLNGSGIDAGNTQIKNVGKATTDDAAVNKKQMDEAVKAASDATKALGNNTISLGDDSGSTTTAKTLNTTGGIQFNIKGQTGTDALITTSASGDDVTITPTAKLTAAVTAAEKSADKDLSNLSAAGNTHIQDLAKSAASWNVQTNGDGTTAVVGGDTVNFINGDNIAITNTGHAITIGTAKNVSFDKVTVGGMTLDKNGILSGISSITGSGTGAPTMTFNSQNGNTPANVSINSNLDMGGHRITGVGPAEKPTDAVNKQQVDQALRGLAGLADNAARQYASKAGANAAALAALKPIQYDPLEPTQIMAGVGNYKSQTAVALGMAHYTNENTMFNIGVSLDSHDNMVNAGVTHKFGYSPEKKAIPNRYKGGPISSIYVMQDEMQSLLAKDQEKDAVISKQASEIDTLRQQNEDMQRKIDMILAKLQ